MGDLTVDYATLERSEQSLQRIATELGRWDVRERQGGLRRRRPGPG